ncbi:MAG TPA: formylglycine-generating enzyme family protein [Mycobacteriales bacterium]|nr:formylglycine-generating enzyme family protein [Mycobacteriales bacterium]
MVTVPSGEFVMGSDAHYPEERPAHRREVAAFAIDAHPVTNAEFRRFVKDTGWTTTAERSPDPADFPGAAPADLVPGSLVFTPTAGPVPLDDWQRWWVWTPGADWRHPQGPGSTLHGLDRHPVVHVSFEDATGYAEWAGKSLPAEVEWEYAARAGRPATAYAWGEEMSPRGRAMANTWVGEFPWRNDDNRYPLTSPVGSYPPDPWGLTDMIGNVWEWTCSPWSADHDGGAPESAVSACCGVTPLTEADRRTIKGGSHLCAPTYCQRYRPPARQGQAVRSTTSHIGFRCVIRTGEGPN